MAPGILSARGRAIRRTAQRIAMASVLTLTTGDKCSARDVAVQPVGSGAGSHILKEREPVARCCVLLGINISSATIIMQHHWCYFSVAHKKARSMAGIV